MTTTFATLIHVAPKLGVEELVIVRNNLVGLMGSDFAKRADTDKLFINQLVAENIDFKRPEDGEVIFRLK